MTDCDFPHFCHRDETGRCVSTICPGRDDCDDAGEEPRPITGLEARVSSLEAELQAVVKDWSEFKRDLGLFLGRTEGGDRGRE